MYCAYHFNGISFDNSEYSPSSFKVYFNVLKNLSVVSAKFKYAKSLLFNKFNPFNIRFIQNLILLLIKSESCSLLSKVDLSFFFCFNNFCNCSCLSSLNITKKGFFLDLSELVCGSVTNFLNFSFSFIIL